MKQNTFSRLFSALFVIVLLAAFLAPCVSAGPNPGKRAIINFPKVGEYQVLKCDFHMHSVFSDGQVWPSIRVLEAWRDGLDAIALTDHIEYLPHKDDLGDNLNRSCAIAEKEGSKYGIIVIRGSEVTRKNAFGHHNVIFTTDNNALKIKGFIPALEEAKKQGSFIFYNHPGWHSPTRHGYWNPKVHDEQYKLGLMNGIEVINGRSYYPDAHKWAIEKKLTMFANSDIHGLIAIDYENSHRPMTLVLARERSAKAIKEALFARRTVIWAKDMIYGEQQFLEPMFKSGVSIERCRSLKGKATVRYTINNTLPFPVELQSRGKVHEVSCPRSISIPAGRAVIMTLKGRRNNPEGKKTLLLPYSVENMWIGPEKPLTTTLEVPIKFVSSKSKK
jgi:3',5'-nucleoside bisphosphate phosphatase